MKNKKIDITVDEDNIRSIYIQIKLFGTVNRVLNVIKNGFVFNKILANRISYISLIEANLFSSIWKFTRHIEDLIARNFLFYIGEEELKQIKISYKYLKSPFYRGHLLKLLDEASLTNTSKLYFKPVN
mgnify:CR=1 FL=1